MDQDMNKNRRLQYYDKLVKQIVIYGTGSFFLLGSLITLIWFDV